MKSRKLLSLLLALMMMLSVVPFYASAAAEALTQANVTQWPTLSYKNADNVVHFGQTLADALVINDDEIVLDASGNQVAGHFEFMKPELISTPKVGTKANIKFVPDDTTTYAGFNKLFSSLLYDVVATTPVYVDEANDPVVASEVEVGATLSTAVLSGGAMTNPYNANEPNISTRAWEWDTTENATSTVINESGYYTAVFAPVGYELTYAEVYVKVKSNASSTTISEAPSATLTYDGATTWADVELTGGKAMSGDTEVAGKFTIDNAGSSIVETGTYTLNITFTPDDTESYLPSTGTATVTVNPAPFKFTDENGAEIVPEITVPYGTEYSSLRTYFYSYLNGSEIARYYNYYDNDGNMIDEHDVIPVNTSECKVLVRSDSKNYVNTELVLKLTVEQTDVKVNIFALTNTIQVRKANLNDPTPTGTFAIYVDGVLLKDGVKENNSVEWNPTVSKEYEIKAVYTPAENDPVNVEDVTSTTSVKLERKITYISQINGGNPSYLCGATVTLSAAVDPESFETWVITDANGNAVDLGVDLTNSNISFTMPDYDLIIEAKTKNSSSGGGLDIDNIFGDMTEGDSDCWLINIINNIIAKMKQIITTVTELFRSIGDNT